MTDLHTHILPGMDDGAKTLSDARTLLQKQLSQAVDRVALTSHYHCEAEPMEAFLDRREAAMAALAEICPSGLRLKRGCEVYFSPQLLYLDLQPLCLEGTRVLLLELPVLQRPAFLREVLTALRQRGIIPLIAHAERYQYVARDPGILAEWMDLGAVIQVNSQSVIDGGLARRLIKWGLCQVIASDTHSAAYRPPNLRAALDAVSDAMGPEKARQLEHQAKVLFSGGELQPGPVHIPRRVLGFWL